MLNYWHVVIIIKQVFIDKIFGISTKNNIGKIKKLEIEKENVLKISTGQIERISVN